MVFFASKLPLWDEATSLCVFGRDGVLHAGLFKGNYSLILTLDYARGFICGGFPIGSMDLPFLNFEQPSHTLTAIPFR